MFVDNKKENERIDDLEIDNLRIIQKKDGFCFGIDSVLLSDFAKNIKNNSKVIDLGTGTGILGFLLLAKTKISKIIGIEIQKEIAEMAQRSIRMNKLEEKFEVLNYNIKDIDKVLKTDSYDAVITNPPYKKINSGKINDNEMKLISRHEIKANLEDFIKISFKMLKDKGALYIVHRAERLVDIMAEMRKCKMEPKRIRFVYSNKTSESKLVLIEAIKNGRSSVRVEKPLYVYDNDGAYTDEILKIYNKNSKGD
ncbi:MAG: tRNA1(Val) (adenine(37)-N6)-methyltransferase [Clostridia bacterium]|nr:tRNA1(Val) (adenine(37)-N6)-methyltransferase [Clostridia bacterium]